MDIFDLVATLSLDSSEYEEGLQGAESNASSVGSKILGGLGKVGAGVGAVVGAVGAGVSAVSGALVSGTKDLASYGDEVDKESQKLHMSAEGYQEWSAILEHSGSSISGLKMGMKTLTNELDKGLKSTEDARKAYDELAISYSNGEISIEEFEKKNAELEESVHDSLGAFGELGFSLNDVAKMAENPEDAFGQIITKLQEMDDETQRTAIANDLLGRSAVELAPLLNTSAEETEAMRQRVHELGGVLSDEAVKASASFQDQLQDMQTAQQSLSRNMLSEFLPSITTVMGGLTDIFAGDYDSGLDQISQGIDNIVTNVADKLPEFMDVGTNILFSILDAIVDNLPKVIETGMDVIKKLILGITDMLPELIDTATELLITIINELTETLPELLPKIIDAILTVVQKIVDNLPTILQSLLGLITAIVESLLTEGLPIIIRALPDLIMGIINFILTAIPDIINAVITIVMAIAQNLPVIIQQIVDVLPDLITNIINAILDNLPIFIDAGIQLFLALIEAMPEIILAIVEAIPQIIEAIVVAIVKAFPKIVEVGKKLLTSLAEGLGKIGNIIGNTVSKIWNAIKNALTEKIAKIKEIGANILQGLVDGIKSKITAVTDTIKNVAGKISDGFKNFFGISSPSKLFKEYGKFLDEGFAIGVEDNADTVDRAMDKTFDFSEPIVGVTNQANNGTMGTGRETSRIIELLEMLVDKDPVEIGANSDGIFNLVRKKSVEYHKSNNRSAFA